MRIPLAGGQNKRFSVNQDAQTLVNLYLDADSEEPETSPAMYKVPGKSSFSTVGTGPIMAMIDSAAQFWRYRTTRFTASTATATRRWSGRFHSSVRRSHVQKPLSGDIRHRLWRMGQQRNIFDAGYRP